MTSSHSIVGTCCGRCRYLHTSIVDFLNTITYILENNYQIGWKLTRWFLKWGSAQIGLLQHHSNSLKWLKGLLECCWRWLSLSCVHPLRLKKWTAQGTAWQTAYRVYCIGWMHQSLFLALPTTAECTPMSSWFKYIGIFTQDCSNSMSFLRAFTIMNCKKKVSSSSKFSLLLHSLGTRLNFTWMRHQTS